MQSEMITGIGVADYQKDQQQESVFTKINVRISTSITTVSISVC